MGTRKGRKGKVKEGKRSAWVLEREGNGRDLHGC